MFNQVAAMFCWNSESFSVNAMFIFPFRMCHKPFFFLKEIVKFDAILRKLKTVEPKTHF